MGTTLRGDLFRALAAAAQARSGAGRDHHQDPRRRDPRSLGRQCPALGFRRRAGRGAAPETRRDLSESVGHRQRDLSCPWPPRAHERRAIPHVGCNAFDFEVLKDKPSHYSCSFFTKWYPPVKVLEKLPEVFPNLAIDIYGYDLTYPVPNFAFEGRIENGKLDGLDEVDSYTVF